MDIKFISKLIKLELKFIFRHTRTKQVALSLLIAQVSILPLIVAYDGEFSLIRELSTASILSLFPGLFTVAYGQYYFAWDAKLFSLLCIKKISWTDYITAKFLFLAASTFSYAIISISTLVYFNSKLLFPYIYTILYNAGASSVVVLGFALFNFQKINASAKGIFSNYQGMGKNQQLISLVIVIIPLLLCSTIIYTQSNEIFYSTLCIIGICSLASSLWWCKKIALKLQDNKYKLLKAFNNY